MECSRTPSARIRPRSGLESISGGPQSRRPPQFAHQRMKSLQLTHRRTCKSNPHLSYASHCAVGRPLTAEITLILPNVAIRFREITANFGGWFAVLPDDFAKFFIYTPYEFPLNFLSPKIVAGTLLFEPSLTGAKNRWKVETANGDDQAVMTLYSTLLGPLLPLGFAIFNGKFPAGNWEGILEWKERIKDTANGTIEA